MSLGLGLKLPVLAGKRPLFGSTAKAIKRYITELSAAGSMYDQFSSPIVLDGDFEWEMEFFGVTTGLAPLISSSVGDNLARIQLDGTLRSFGGNDVSTRSIDSTTVVNDGKIRTLGGSRVGATITARVNGVIEGTDTNADNTGTITIDTLFTSGSNYSDGCWLSLKIWKGGDRTTGTLVVDAKKDGDGSTNVITNEAATLGPNLWTYGLSGSINAEWSSMLGTTWAGPNVIGDTYLVRCKVTTLSAPAAFRMSGHDELIDSVGEYEFIATLTKDWGNLNFSTRGSIPASIELEYVTVQKIELDTPYLTRVNQTTDEVTLYTEVEDGWLSAHDYWTYGPSISSGTEGTLQIINGAFSTSIPTNVVVRWTSVVTDLTSGQIRYRVGNTDVVSTTSNGEFSGDQLSGSNDLAVMVGTTQCNAGAKMITTAKRFLEVV